LLSNKVKRKEILGVAANTQSSGAGDKARVPRRDLGHRSDDGIVSRSARQPRPQPYQDSADLRGTSKLPTMICTGSLFWLSVVGLIPPAASIVAPMDSVGEGESTTPFLRGILA
jgi:hypothetical protein